MNADLKDGSEDSTKAAQFANTEAQTSKADLVITEMIYKLREYGADNDRPQRTWLDALYVFFTIQYQGKKRESVYFLASDSRTALHERFIVSGVSEKNE
ncbi:hypothetical protein ACHAPZ_005025 [Fusarium culmorum]